MENSFISQDYKFIFPLEVYTEDTDFGGVVYHANHIKYMERARTTWAYSVGLRLDDLKQKNCFFVVRNIAIEYLFPARLHDRLEVVSSIIHFGRTSLTFQQDIRLSDETEKWISRASVILVTINSAGKPIELPKQIVESFKNVT